MAEQTAAKPNRLGVDPIPTLLLSLAVPSVVANLFDSVYNIIDQIYIGNLVGFLGNAATNVAFPLTTLCMAIGFMAGVGGAAGFNLNLGQKKTDEARQIVGSSFSFMWISGIIICLLTRIFLKPLMISFGATDEILPYALEYASITLWGIPFLVFMTGAAPLVRGDGNAKYSMFAVVFGAILDALLDYFFMGVFGWGIKGAAWATVIAQAVSAGLFVLYFPRYKNVHFVASDFIPRWHYVRLVCKLGFASFAFMASSLVVQVVLNNLLKTYGALSVYGAEVTIAVAGIMQKINALFVAVVTGIVQGSQPICSFNYGAQKYARVRSTLRLLLTYTTGFSIVVFILLQCFPRQVIGLFGEGSPEYFEFGEMYVRSFTAALFLNGTQTSSTTFFPSIGKAWKGTVISVSKQLGFLVPLLLILSHFFGLTGILFATPTADVLSFIVAVYFLVNELRQMPKEDLA